MRDSYGAQVPEAGRCGATGKRMWSTRRRARTAARRVNPGEHMSAYRCDGCGWFHIGHIPRAVVDGVIERSDLRPRGDR